MAELTKCEVCGHDMASDAKTCPNCGHPTKPPIVARAISRTKKTIENATENVQQAVKSDEAAAFAKGCKNFFAFFFKLLGVLLVNYFISIFVNAMLGAEHGSHSLETYLGRGIAATIIFPITFVWWILVIIGKHFGKGARKGWSVVFFILMILGSFGPLANVGAIAIVTPYYIIRCIMLFIFFFVEVRKQP